MCGIITICNYSKHLLDYDEKIITMTKLLRKRGPDHMGYFMTPHCLMGHTRLAIIDLKNGQQPLLYTHQERTYRMTYNNVNKILDGDQKLQQEYAPAVPLFFLMQELATLLRKVRDERGAIDFDVDEAKVTGYEFALGYNFGNGLLVRAGFNHQKYEIGSDEAEASVIPVYVNYNFNPQVQVWAEARFDAGSDDDENGGANFAYLTNDVYNSAENVFSVGIRYNI